jgi:hypothetical protein
VKYFTGRRRGVRAGAVHESVEAPRADGNSRRYSGCTGDKFEVLFADKFVEIVGVANFEFDPPPSPY